MPRIINQFPSILALIVLLTSCGSSDSASNMRTVPTAEPQQPVLEDSAADGFIADGGDIGEDGEDVGGEDSGNVHDSTVSVFSATDDDKATDDEATDNDKEETGDDDEEETGDDDQATDNDEEEISGVDSSQDLDDAAASSSGEDPAEGDYPSDTTAAGDGIYDGENSDAASSSSPDGAVATPDEVDGTTPGSSDDTVSATQDQTPDDGADIGDPGPSNSGVPAPPRELRRRARITGVMIQVSESWPMQVTAQVSGELPDPCYELWWEVAVDDNTYDVQVWEVSPPPDSGMACAAVIVPFVENVTLGGGFVSEDYTFIVNGEVHKVSL